MTANQQTVVAEAVVDKIVARILALLNGEAIDTSARKVLMLFSGASTGFVVGLESIRRLTDSGHHLTVVLSPSAGYIIGQDRVRQAGAGTIIGGGEWVNAPGLVRETDLVLVPTLSMNLAAHLARGLMDSLLTTLILGARLAGKSVLAIKDGADPAGNAGLVFGASQGAAPALQARLIDNLNTLVAYGLELVPETGFLLAVERQLLRTTVDLPAAGQSEARLPPGPGRDPQLSMVGTRSGGANNHFVTEAELLTLQPGSVLRLSPASRLTPLAQDTARRLNLQLVFE
jgi:hypothetical protein